MFKRYNIRNISNLALISPNVPEVGGCSALVGRTAVDGICEADGCCCNDEGATAVAGRLTPGAGTVTK